MKQGTIDKLKTLIQCSPQVGCKNTACNLYDEETGKCTGPETARLIFNIISLKFKPVEEGNENESSSQT